MQIATQRPERLNQTAQLLMLELADSLALMGAQANDCTDGSRDLIRGTAMRVEDELARMATLIAAIKAL